MNIAAENLYSLTALCVIGYRVPPIELGEADVAFARWMIAVPRRSSPCPHECAPSHTRHDGAPPWSLRHRLPTLLTDVSLLLLCVAILVQTLGVPITLLNVDATDDPFLESLLTGYAIPPSEWTVVGNQDSQLAMPGEWRSFTESRGSPIFRPPILTISLS